MQRPLFSIVIPTRDRPELLRHALRSARLQTCADFEVVVSDNFVARPARAVFDECADERFRYLTPPQPLSMADHWEFACGQARGEYLTVLIDKTVLLPSVLESTRAALTQQPVDLVSWWNENYHLDYEQSGDLETGSYGPRFAGRIAPVAIDTRGELVRRFSMDVRRGAEGVNYCYGKICFGVYSRALVQRIVARCGQLFYPISPDYTSMLPALALADGALDLGRPGLMSINAVGVSNGERYSRDARHALQFLSSTEAAWGAAHWPIGGLFASQHNAVAFDYLHMQRRVDEMQDLQLNLANLLLRVREDLDAVAIWPDEQTRRSQYSIWESHLAAMPADTRTDIERSVARRLGGTRRLRQRLRAGLADAKATVRQMPGVLALYRKIAGPRAIARQFGSVIDAAACADLHYLQGSK